MNEDMIFTALMAVFAAVMFAAVYLLPAAGVVSGVVLMKKKPEYKGAWIALLSVSSLACAAVIIGKVLDIIKFQ